MNVLITGATGFIGSALAARLSRMGHTPTGLSRSADRGRRDVRALSEVWSWDPMKGPPPEPALREADAIVNLAGESVFGLWTPAKKERIYESRIRTTRHLVDGLRHAPSRPRVLVSSSAIGYYGDRGDEPLDETSARGTGFMSDVCRDWEEAAARGAGFGARVVTIRTGLALGTGGGALGAMLKIFRLGLGGRLGSGHQFWPWISLDDLVSLYVHAIETPVEGPLNGTAPEPARNATFTRELAAALGRPAFLHVPGWALSVLGEFSSELLTSHRVLPVRTRETGFTFAHETLASALAHALDAS